MAISYQWRWRRGSKQTVKQNVGASAFSGTWSPCVLSSNKIIEPAGAGSSLAGVCISKPAANATAVPVIVSDDVYMVKLAAAFGPALGDVVSLAADGSVKALAGGEVAVGRIVDYTPVTAGYAHVQAIVNGDATSGELPSGSVSNSELATDVKVGSLAALTTTEKSNVVGAINEVKGVADSAWAEPTPGTHIADAKVDYTTGDLDLEAEIIAAVNTTNGKINTVIAALETLGLLEAA